MLGEAREGRAASYSEALVRRTFLHVDDSVDFIDWHSAPATLPEEVGGVVEGHSHSVASALSGKK